MLVLIFALLGMAESGKAESAKTSWGKTIDMKTAVTVADALKTKAKEKKILMRGKVDKVCEKSGCWMVMKDSNKNDIRITFAKYAFFVPATLMGKEVDVQGKLFEKEVSVSEQKHYLEDAGASKEKIAAVQKPKKEFRFVATGVRLAAKK